MEKSLHASVEHRMKCLEVVQDPHITTLAEVSPGQLIFRRPIDRVDPFAVNNIDLAKKAAQGHLKRHGTVASP